MPCYEPNASDYARVNAEKEINKLTKMLCSVMNHIQSKYECDISQSLSEEVQEWWKKHSAWDNKRKEGK